MKSSFVLWAIAGCCWTQTAFARNAPVPPRLGVYIIDVGSGVTHSMGNFYDWALSPDGRFVVGGNETGTRTPFYEISAIPTSGGNARRLGRFPLHGPGGAAFYWSSDSSHVRVVADLNDDGKDEVNNFAIGRASAMRLIKERKRSLSVLARKRLKARFPQISDILFSPNGTRVVAYLSRSSFEKPDFDGGLWSFTPDGNNLKRLTRNEPYPRHDFQDVQPHWLPDGKRLAFRRTVFEDEGI